MDPVISMALEADLILAYNVAFDKNVLLSELYRRGYLAEVGIIAGKPWKCVMLMVKEALGVGRYLRL